MRRWWTSKYKLPVTSREWEVSIFEDLYVEFLEDLIVSDKDFSASLYEKHLAEGKISTGDPLLDRWERQIARGEDPDLDYMEDSVAAERDALVRERYRRMREEEALEEGFYIEPLPSFSPLEERQSVASRDKKEALPEASKLHLKAREKEETREQKESESARLSYLKAKSDFEAERSAYREKGGFTEESEGERTEKQQEKRKRSIGRQEVVSSLMAKEREEALDKKELLFFFDAPTLAWKKALAERRRK